VNANVFLHQRERFPAFRAQRLSSVRDVKSSNCLAVALASAIVDARHGGSRLYGSRARAHARRTDLRPKRGVKLERKKNCRIKTKSYGPVARPVPKRVESERRERAPFSSPFALLSSPFFSSFFVLISRPLQFSGFSQSARGHRRRFIISRERTGTNR